MQEINVKELLIRGVEKIYPTREALEKVLKNNQKLRIYYGIDPTGKLHLGHVVQLLKLGQFQQLGHEIIILIGDFTAQIGDPTDKKATRQKLSKEEVGANAKDYRRLIGKIINLETTNVRFFHNEEWTNKLKPEDVLELASNFTVSQLLERDMFQERIKANKEIYLHEFLYPVFQAYDAVTMDVDMQVGGNDQTFNMLAGRTLMKKLKNKEKFVLTTKLLIDRSGKKMGKTEGNIITLDSQPKEMYGKIMSWSDDLIVSGFELLTKISQDEINSIADNIKSNQMNPRDAKAHLAREITALIWGQSKAIQAEENFINIFVAKNNPKDVQNVKIKDGEKIVNVMVNNNLAQSSAEAQRLIIQDGVKFNGQKVASIDERAHQTGMLQVGKRKFLKIIIN